MASRPWRAMLLAICSQPLPIMNMANPTAMGVFPAAASPEVIPSMSCSLIPTRMNLEGKLSAK